MDSDPSEHFNTLLSALQERLAEWPVFSSAANLSLEHYGQQLTTNFLVFDEVFRGALCTADSLRLLQINRFITSGVTLAGNLNGFNSEYRSIRTAECSETGYVLQRTLNRSVSSAILHLTIRVEQWFKDGNHRTALLALIMSLLEHGVCLTSSFHVYRAYTILSARFHPGNESNYLNRVARTAVERDLFVYLKSRTVPAKTRQVDNMEYLRRHALSVRLLPISVLLLGGIWGRLQEEQERREIWGRLTPKQKQWMKWTFIQLNKGPQKLR
ncbi:hypothetical protein C8J56DRAFT_912083 [Mycena floridula]|nr:hypothetical protein C8J56DRAFT_912083 [Mycena floridula]